MRQLSAGIVVRRGQEVLLQFKRKYNQWEFPGGKLEGTEPALYCAKRELKEETGLQWIGGKQLCYIDNRNGFGCVMFQCTNWGGIPTIMEPDKHSAIGWFDINNLPIYLTPDTQTSIKAGCLKI